MESKKLVVSGIFFMTLSVSAYFVYGSYFNKNTFIVEVELPKQEVSGGYKPYTLKVDESDLAIFDVMVQSPSRSDNTNSSDNNL